MKKYRLQIGLDVDDVLYDCNGYALALLNRAEGIDPPYTVHQIRSWGTDEEGVNKRIRYFGDPEFVRTQPVLPGAKAFVERLSRVADVFFVSAVPPQCMSARAMRLAEDFPEVPTRNILLGHRKDLVNLDILLDDAAHNIVHTPATYPVLFRRPWNMHLSGLLSVTGYDDFLHLVDILRNSFTDARPDLSEGGVICLVGPTGSGKNELVDELVRSHDMVRPMTSTTRPRRRDESAEHYHFLSEEAFLAEQERGEYLETTVYGGYYFGTSTRAVDSVVESGKVAVLPIDICGALALKNRYREKALLLFLDRRREDVLMDIVSRDLTPWDKTCRILSLDDEMRNEELCDLTLHVDRAPDALAAHLATLVKNGPVRGE